MNRMMKLLLILSLALTAVAVSAQRHQRGQGCGYEQRGQGCGYEYECGHERGRGRGESGVSMEKRAEVMSNRMAIEFELTDKQKQEIYNCVLESAKKYDQRMEKNSNEMRDQIVDSRKAYKAEMEKILTKKQFAKWEQMHKERMDRAKKGREIKQQRGE